MSNIDPVQRAEMLADYDGLIAQGKKHKAAREEVIDQWKSVRGWNESKIYNLIQGEWRRRNQEPKGETEEAETSEAEVKAGPVKAETTEATGTAAATDQAELSEVEATETTKIEVTVEEEAPDTRAECDRFDEPA